jgi:hypothetical protein
VLPARTSLPATPSTAKPCSKKAVAGSQLSVVRCQLSAVTQAAQAAILRGTV